MATQAVVRDDNGQPPFRQRKKKNKVRKWRRQWNYSTDYLPIKCASKGVTTGKTLFWDVIETQPYGTDNLEREEIIIYWVHIQGLWEGKNHHRHRYCETWKQRSIISHSKLYYNDVHQNCSSQFTISKIEKINQKTILMNILIIL